MTERRFATRLRRYLVWQHRITGLGMALFVAILGITGSLLCFKPYLVHDNAMAMPNHGSGPKLNFAQLAIAAERAYPHARTSYLFAPGDTASVRMQPRIDPKTAKPFTDTSEVVLIDPWTGAPMGAGAMEMGTAPGFYGLVWDLHKSMALGPTGGVFVGYVALVWAVDCLVGLYLTFPIKLRGFWRAWLIAWKVKLRSGNVRFNFDLHRATGVWLWPLLFLIAWSGVKYNNSDVYERVMKSVVPYESDDELIKHQSRPNRSSPKLSWVEGYRRSREELERAVKAHGLTIKQERVFAYISDFGVYSYGVQTSGDFRFSNPVSSVYVDGDTGELRDLTLPDTMKPGNFVTQLADALHLADFYSPIYRVVEGFVGILIAALSLSGVVVWWHKRRARRKSRANRLAHSIAGGGNRPI